MKICVSLILNNFKSPWPCKGTSEFDLKIGVCFVENGSSKIGVCFKLRPRLFGFFSLVGLTSVKARSLEDSCKEIGSCKHSTLIPLQRSTRTNSLDIKSAI